MPAVIYLHGFLSSPESTKCQVAREFFAQHYPEVQYHAPFLSSYPAEAWNTIEGLVAEIGETPCYVLGSSLGGFWSTRMVEIGLVERAVLVNPSVKPQDHFGRFVGVPQKNFYREISYELGPKHLEELNTLYCPTITRPDAFWLLAQTGDETLDYREAAEKFAQCRCTIEQGGDHSFQGFDRWLPKIASFFDF